MNSLILISPSLAKNAFNQIISGKRVYREFVRSIGLGSKPRALKEERRMLRVVHFPSGVPTDGKFDGKN